MINQGFTFAVAPMMEWSDRWYRGFVRLMSRRAVLYSEMVTAAAVVHGDRDRLLGFSAVEHPLVLQLGGADPAQLAEAARIGEGFGYDEINLNVGCPSDRVQSGAFGAALMLDAPLVAKCAAAMAASVSIPVTIKCRVGVDEQIAEETLPDFIRCVSDAGVNHFIIHARQAWLKGLSPKQNREIPPLQYDLVREMKRQFPSLCITLNGGLANVEQAKQETATLNGAMIGRAAYHNPWILTAVDQQIYGETAPPPTRDEVVQGLIEYAALAQSDGVRLHDITRHVLGLFLGQPGARKWRQILSQEAVRPGADWRVIAKAAAVVLPESFAA